MVSRSRISGARRKVLNRLESQLEIVSLEMMMKIVMVGTHLKSSRDRVLDVRSYNAESADAK